MVQVQVDLLLDAVNRTQPARHGSGPSGLLTAEHVDALLVLDQHPALMAVSLFDRDHRWTTGRSADQAEQARAGVTLDLLDEDDVAARVHRVEETHGDAEVQDCPVCGNRTLVPNAMDEWGYGVVEAVCPVCSYAQGPHATYERNLEMEWEFRWKDD